MSANSEYMKAYRARKAIEAGRVPRVANRDKIHCPRGHEYDSVKPDGARFCSICNRRSTAAADQRKREARASNPGKVGRLKKGISALKEADKRLRDKGILKAVKKRIKELTK